MVLLDVLTSFKVSRLLRFTGYDDPAPRASRCGVPDHGRENEVAPRPVRDAQLVGAALQRSVFLSREGVDRGLFNQ